MLERMIEMAKVTKECLMVAFIDMEKAVLDLRMFLNDVLSGGCIPKEWKGSRVVLVHKGGSKKELKIIDLWQL